MAVTYDNSAKNIQTSTVVGVCSFTVAADACLVVGVGTTTNVSISQCAANGNVMTQLATILNNASGMRTNIFVLTAAPLGTVSISANMVDNVAAEIFVGGASYLGMATANTFSPVQLGSAGAVNNFALSLSTSTTDRVIMFAGGVNVFTATNSTTRLTDNAHNAFRLCDTAGAANAISLSASAIITSQNLTFMGFSIRMTNAQLSSGAATQTSLLGVSY